MHNVYSMKFIDVSPLDFFQSLQRTISDSHRDLDEARRNHNNVQGDYNRAQLRYEVQIVQLDSFQSIFSFLAKREKL